MPTLKVKVPPGKQQKQLTRTLGREKTAEGADKDTSSFETVLFPRL